MLRPGALGDALLAVPALRALRAAHPGWQLTYASHGGASRLLEAVGEVDRGLAFDDPSLAWMFDAGLSPGGALPAAVVAWLADRGRLEASLEAHGIEPRVAAPSRPTDASSRHCAEYLLESVAALAGAAPLDARPLSVPAVVSDRVLVHPGSGAPRKNWPAARFAALIEALDELGVDVELVVGEADCEAADEVDGRLRRKLPRLVTLSLGVLAGRLAGCLAYVGNDSGVSHLAGLVGARTCTLFGPTSPDVWRPLGPDVVVAPFETEPEVLARVIQAGGAVRSQTVAGDALRLSRGGAA